MKKSIAILLVLATMVLCLAGCAGKKATAVVTFENVTSGTILGIPDQKNIGAGLELNVMTVNVRKEGVYPFLLNLDGNEYTFILTYENGKFAAEADEGLTFSIK